MRFNSIVLLCLTYCVIVFINNNCSKEQITPDNYSLFLNEIYTKKIDNKQKEILLPETVTLPELFNYLLNVHPLIKKINITLESFEYENKQASSLIKSNPVIELLAENRAISGDFNFEVALSKEYLFGSNFEPVINSIQINKIQLNKELEAFKQKLYLELKEYYLKIIAKNKNIQELNNFKQTLENILIFAEKQYENGIILEYEYLLIKSEQIQLINQIDREKNELNNLLNEFKIFLFQSVSNANIQLKPLNINYNLPEIEFNKLLNIALENRIEIASKYSEIKITETEIKLLENENFPGMSFSLLYKKEDANHFIGTGFEIPIPIINLNENAIKSKNAKIKSMIQEVYSIIQELKLELIKHLGKVLTLKKYLLNANKTLIPNLLKINEISKNAYENGSITLLDTLQIQHKYYDSLLAYNNDLLEFVESIIQLEKVCNYEIFKMQ